MSLDWFDGVCYEVRAFYLNGAQAFHTWNIGTHSRDIEIKAACSREDIGRVEWRIAGSGWLLYRAPLAPRGIE